jgi:hypothetical protein
MLQLPLDRIEELRTARGLPDGEEKGPKGEER